MPKIKTSRGTAKRFKVTGTGKVRRRKAFLRHQLTCKTAKQKRQLRHGGIVHPSNERAIKRLIPYM
ncbi:MAG: 50S ribosomal protein L35 [Deltaproteobacteria bacterium]|jgi:large subunit ribosomal protein L35|nr:50S ribosomal protein L35 [Deltaproteobacteria bacterium]MBI3386231.1 50S ribosomal protein L35 [Deltaproteobacteria bacterium]